MGWRDIFRRSRRGVQGVPGPFVGSRLFEDTESGGLPFGVVVEGDRAWVVMVGAGPVSWDVGRECAGVVARCEGVSAVSVVNAGCVGDVPRVGVSFMALSRRERSDPLELVTEVARRYSGVYEAARAAGMDDARPMTGDELIRYAGGVCGVEGCEVWPPVVGEMSEDFSSCQFSGAWSVAFEVDGSLLGVDEALGELVEGFDLSSRVMVSRVVRPAVGSEDVIEDEDVVRGRCVFVVAVEGSSATEASRLGEVLADELPASARVWWRRLRGRQVAGRLLAAGCGVPVWDMPVDVDLVEG